MANMTTLLSGKAINVPLYYTFMLHILDVYVTYSQTCIPSYTAKCLRVAARGGGGQMNYKLTFVQWNKKCCIFTLKS